MKIGDIVYYNGNTDCYVSCDDPAVLVYGKTYEVSNVEIGRWSTCIRLKGVRGEFNSVWFTPASPRLKFEHLIRTNGFAGFKYEDQKVFDMEGNELGNLLNISRFAFNNQFVIDFSKMIVKKA